MNSCFISWNQNYLIDLIFRPNIKLDREYLHAPGAGPGQAFIIGVGSVESAYLVQSVPGLTDPMDPDLPALMVGCKDSF